MTLDKREKNPKSGKIFIVDLDGFLPLPKLIKNQPVEYLSHESMNIYSHETKMMMAQELLDKYKKEAKLILTSKLHCALPCIAMGIPVIFFGDKKNTRLKLIEQFIPLHPYRTIDALYTPQRIFPDHNRIKLIAFLKNMLIKKFYHLRYFFMYRRKINWNPEPLDIEEIKKGIIHKFLSLIKKSI